jgi:flavin reductase (DIM6/NTAB) family NADH-FMN oxidoreductase RutF
VTPDSEAFRSVLGHNEEDHHIVVGMVEDLQLVDRNQPLVFFRGSFRKLHHAQQAVPV